MLNFALEIRKQCSRFRDNNMYNKRLCQGSDAKYASIKKLRKEKDYVYKCSNAYYVLNGSYFYRMWLHFTHAQSYKPCISNPLREHSLRKQTRFK